MDVNDLFGGGKRIGLQFPKIGTTYKLRVIDFKVENQLDMQTGEPKKWSNGEVMKQVAFRTEVLEGETRKYDRHTETFSEVADDNGERWLFAAGGIFTAMKKALQEAGAKPAPGGIIDIKFVGVGKPSQPGYNPPKKYEAKYTAGPAPVEDPFA